MTSHDDEKQLPNADSEDMPEAGSPGQETERLRQELATKTDEAAQNYDRFVRERAELENFKRRTQRDKAEALRFANESLVRDLLPVLDNLERAVEHADGGGNGQPLVEGVRLVLKTALDVLERYGVSRLDAVGQAFDPNRHEAIATVPGAGREPNQVVEQFRPGYLLHDRLIRPAQVSVAARGSGKGQNVENVEDDD